MVKYKTQQYEGYEIDRVPDYIEVLHYLENSLCTCNFYLHIPVHIIGSVRFNLPFPSFSKKRKLRGGGEIMYIYL